MPNLIAHQICDVQPMTGPTGTIFTYKGQTTLDAGYFYAPRRPGAVLWPTDRELDPQAAQYDRMPHGLRRELDILKQVDCIEIVRDI